MFGTIDLIAPVGIAAIGLILLQTATTDGQRAVAKLLLVGAVLVLGVELVLAAMAMTPETRPLARRYLLERSPDDAFTLQSGIVWELLRTICDEPTLTRARDWVPVERRERAGYAFTEARRCIELRKYHEPSLRAFLATMNP